MVFVDEGLGLESVAVLHKFGSELLWKMAKEKEKRKQSSGYHEQGLSGVV